MKVIHFIAISVIVSILSVSVKAVEIDAGITALQSGHYTEALKILVPLANAGNDEAQRIVGEMCYNGQGMKRNALASFKWNELAAEAGNKVAQYNLGYLYEKGEGIDPSNAQAINWYTKAANQGYPAAERKLGDLYATSNRDISIYWYDQARQSGDEKALEQFSKLSTKRENERSRIDAAISKLRAENERIDREEAEKEDRQRRVERETEQDNQPEESIGAYIQRVGRENTAILGNIDRKTKVAINQSNRIRARVENDEERKQSVQADRGNQRRAVSESATEQQSSNSDSQSPKEQKIQQQNTNTRIVDPYLSEKEERWKRQLSASKKILELGVPLSTEKTEDAARKSVLKIWDMEKRGIESAHNMHNSYGRIIKFGSLTCSPHRGPRTKEYPEGEIFDWRCGLAYTLEVVDQGKNEGIGISK